VFLLLAPRLALRLLLSTGDYGDIFPRLVGMLLLGLGVLVFQIIRYRVESLYPSTLGVRAGFCLGFVGLYLMSRDPLFLLLLAVVGIGVTWTAISFVRDRRQGAP
jgi:uncharacterized protein YjeT (DUF2065 family)